ncbi:MAG: cupin domain-containing protein [Devosia sp.]|uniref:cupin domain-containing protein n=1 Tax=Devosia sp. TaxID=1871048 RepID=UPI001AD38D8E|nr:cupin domain-containing protein [Devosia sp.]MBN9316882.1 cupin domain-containing protein [Devosia sp.]
MQSRIGRLADLPLTFGEGPLFGGRGERRLAKAAGLTQFGVNHVTLAPGARTASRHWHQAEDEFVVVLAGEATLVDDNGSHPMKAWDFVGFVAGEPNAHHILNMSSEPVELLVIGARRPGEETIHYPDDDFGPIRK